MIFKYHGLILPHMKMWNSKSNGYSFVITEDTEQVEDEWTGFNASWKKIINIKQAPNRIDGGPWKTFEEAKAACEATLKQLRNKN